MIVIACEFDLCMFYDRINIRFSQQNIWLKLTIQMQCTFIYAENSNLY